MSSSKASPRSQATQAAPACTTELTQPCAVTVSLFGAAWAPEPTHEITGTWQDLVEGIRAGLQRTAPAPRDDSAQAWQRAKRSLPGVVCAPFSGARGNDTVGDHTAIVLDVDHPTPDLLARLERYRAVAYETPSSRRKGDDDRRLRVAVALTGPVPPHAVPAARAAFARELGLDPDASGVAGADAASQLAFIGRIDGTPEREMWTYEGAPWTPPPPGAAPAKRERSAEHGDIATALWGADHVPDLSALAPLLEPAEPGGMRRSSRDLCRGLGGWLARRGYHPDAIEKAVLALHDGRSDQPDVRAELARETAEQFYAGDARAAGMTAVRAHLEQIVADPDVAAAYLESAVADPWVQTAADVWSQYIAERRGGSKNDTCESTDAESEPAPGQTTEGLWQWVDADDLAKELPPVDYQCDLLGFVRGDTRPDMIVGPPGYGKTGLSQAYALAVASDKPLFGSSPVKSGIVYHIDNEQGLAATQRRYQMLAGGMGVDLRSLRGKLRVFADGVRLSRGDRVDERAVEALRRNTDGADIVIVDSLVTLGMGIDENSVAFADVMMRLRAITQKGGPKFLVLHHSGKGESSANGRGTSAIDGERGSTWVGSETFTWRHKKKSASHTGEPLAPFTTAWEETTPTFREQLAGVRSTARIVCVGSERSATGEPTDNEKQKVSEFVAKHIDGISQRQVIMALGESIGRNRLVDIITVMVENGALYRSGSKSSARLHVSAPPEGS